MVYGFTIQARHRGSKGYTSYRFKVVDKEDRDELVKLLERLDEDPGQSFEAQYQELDDGRYSVGVRIHTKNREVKFRADAGSCIEIDMDEAAKEKPDSERVFKGHGIGTHWSIKYLDRLRGETIKDAILDHLKTNEPPRNDVEVEQLARKFHCTPAYMKMVLRSMGLWDGPIFKR